MTQLFREDGQVIPVTIVTAGPCFVTYKKDLEKDGYRSVQLGSSETKRVNKPLAGFFKKFLEFRMLNPSTCAIGDKLVTF